MSFSSYIYIAILIVSSLNIGNSQNSTNNQVILESVFIIGENEAAYEKLVGSTTNNLYKVCDNSMELAYTTWQDMLVQFENFAKENEFEINGVKIWMNAFWHSNGTISHIAFYPKLNSKNVNFEKLTKVLTAFIDEYQMSYQSEEVFAHYGQASFPVYPVRVSNN